MTSDVVRLFDRAGIEALAPLVAERHSAPGVASALVDLSQRCEVNLLRLFSADEVVDGARRYLLAAHESPEKLDVDWAWTAFWFGTLPWQRRLALILQLADLVRTDDDALWTIGDGPLSEVENHLAGRQRIDELLPTNPTLARVRQLVDEIP